MPVFARIAIGWWARLMLVVISISLVLGAAVALHSSQAASRRGIANRYQARAGLAANFVGTYVGQLTVREQHIALTTMAGSDPTASFDSAVQAFGFPAAVLLDSSGKALAVEPSDPALIGTQLGSKYAHLSAALQGRVAVSNIVPSAATASAVVAFAVPFQTASGRRVFSGAYAISDTPLAAFLNDTTTLKAAHVYLIDAGDNVLASSGTGSTNAEPLAQRDPGLWQAVTRSPSGGYGSGSARTSFAEVAIPGTPWSLITSAPSSQLYMTVEGVTRWMPWVILALLSILIGLADLLAIRLLASRRRLAVANATLATIAHTDGLTGLASRRFLSMQLNNLLANARRHDFPVCVLMIDVDHFKAVNDRFGHRAGDVALRHVADQLSMSLRDGDLLGRWGGEEFLAVLPYTGIDEGAAVAKRLCALVAGSPVMLGSSHELVTIRTSVGVAVAAGDTVEDLVHRADLGLYEAKSAGRNAVRQGPLVAAAISVRS